MTWLKHFRNLESERATNGRDHAGMSWDEYEEIAQATEELDFGCNFDCNGCTRTDEKACCTGCVFHAPGTAQAYADLWDEEDGFWAPGGCQLPRPMRSPTCLGYSCSGSTDLEDFLFYFQEARPEKAREALQIALDKQATTLPILSN